MGYKRQTRRVTPSRTALLKIQQQIDIRAAKATVSVGKKSGDWMTPIFIQAAARTIFLAYQRSQKYPGILRDATRAMRLVAQDVLMVCPVYRGRFLFT